MKREKLITELEQRIANRKQKHYQSSYYQSSDTRRHEGAYQELEDLLKWVKGEKSV